MAQGALSCDSPPSANPQIAYRTVEPSRPVRERSTNPFETRRINEKHDMVYSAFRKFVAIIRYELLEKTISRRSLERRRMLAIATDFWKTLYALLIHWGIILSLIGASLFSAGCNPLYVINAGLVQTEILLKRRAIDRVVADPETEEGIRDKLTLVTAARNFAPSMSLKPGGSFRGYSALGRDTLAWVVVASRRDAFELHTWWFPIVGSVPYKGFFSKDEAHAEALELESRGLETLVRGTSAFSTLGWFDDPVMTPLLREADEEIVATVIHEIVHTTLWIPDHVAFNESLAQFIGVHGAVEFYRQRVAQDRTSEVQRALVSAEEQVEQSRHISAVLDELIPELTTLYTQELSREQKIIERDRIVAKNAAPLHQNHPNLKILRRAHNAEILQLKLYYSGFSHFEQLRLKARDWGTFMSKIQAIQRTTEDTGSDPFKELIKFADSD